MGQYRKKPVVVEAVRFDGTSFTADSIVAWAAGPVRGHVMGTPQRLVLTIDTLEGRMNAEAGDWIIRGVQGEFYPCKPDIFDATYEPVDDD